MQQKGRALGWCRSVWFAALVAASLVFSLGFACAVPLAAFATIAALTMRRGAALLLVLAVVFANQCAGFAVLRYPLAADTLAWGGAFALVGVLAVLAAGWVNHRAASAHPILAPTAAFLAGFAAYEGGLFALTVLSRSGLEPYAAPVVLRVFAINATALVGLLVVRRTAASIGLAEAPAGGVGMTQRPV